MVWLQSLNLHHFRNFQSQKLQFHSGLNLLFGANGVGKTNLLEAIYLFSVGRSFRTSNPNEMIEHQQKTLTLFAQFNETSFSHHNQPVAIGLSRDERQWKIRVNGEPVKGMIELAKLVPVKALAPDLGFLSDHHPKHRRRHLDWLVFHVKPEVITLYSRLRQAIAQKNKLLKQSGAIHTPSIEAWNQQIAYCGSFLSLYRLQALQQTEQQVSALLKKHTYPWGEGLCFDFDDGFKTKVSDGVAIATIETDETHNFTDHPQRLELNERYLKKLNDFFEREKACKSCLIGPQRADFRLGFKKNETKPPLSRGQSKSLSLIFALGQARVLQNKSGKEAIILVDDILSEFDHHHLNEAIKLLKQSALQCFASFARQSMVALKPDTSAILLKKQKNNPNACKAEVLWSHPSTPSTPPSL